MHDEAYKYRIPEACRLLLCLSICRIAGRRPEEAPLYATAGNQLMLIGAMCKRIVHKYQTAPSDVKVTRRTGRSVINLRAKVTFDPWLHKQLVHLAPMYVEPGTTKVLDGQMVLDLIRRGLSDPDVHRITALYIERIDPLRTALDHVEHEVDDAVRNAMRSTSLRAQEA